MTKSEPVDRNYYYSNVYNPIDPHGVRRRKSSESTINSKKSKIAGIIYNSTAVYKRLNSNDIYPVKNKSQGRPFSNNFNCRLLLHLNLNSLLNYVDKRNDSEFLIYDWVSLINDAGCDEKVLNLINSDVDLMSDENEIGLHGSTSSSGEVNVIGAGSDKFSFELTDFDNLLKCHHSKDLISINSFNFEAAPLTSNVKYDQVKWSRDDDKKLNENLLKLTSTKITDLESLIESNCNSGKIINFHKIIVQSFGFDDYVFVKTIRDNNGQILKIDTIKPPMNSKGIYEYTPEWIKRFVCYPRYKSGMNLQLLKSDNINEINFTLYNDFKMLIWDVKEKLLSTGLKLEELTPSQIKEDLFNNKIVYLNPKRC